MSDGRYASSGPTETGNGSDWLQKKSLLLRRGEKGSQDVIYYLIGAVSYCLHDLLEADACEP